MPESVKYDSYLTFIADAGKIVVLFLMFNYFVGIAIGVNHRSYHF